MKNQQTLKTLLYTAAACLVLGSAGGFAPAGYADVRINAVNHHHHTDIRLDGDDVLIVAEDRSEARITSSGSLYIEDKQLSLTSEQRAMLKQYNAGIHDIEHRGLEIGKSALDLVGGVLGTLVSEALTGGDPDEDMDEKMRAKTSPIRQQAMELCKVAHSEHRIQDQIAAQIPAFKPYAVMDDDGDHDCHVDGREV